MIAIDTGFKRPLVPFVLVLLLKTALSTGRKDLFDEYARTRDYLRSRRSIDAQCGTANDNIACNASTVLKSLLKGYDNRFRPYAETDKPIEVKVGIRILNFGQVNEVNMDYRMDLHLVQQWNDPRLSSSHPGSIIIPPSSADDLWLPDTYFVNSKRANFHQTTTPNILVTVQPDGTVTYTSRISLRASCPMDFRLYPVDKQHCYLLIESFGLQADDLVYSWDSTDKWLQPFSMPCQNSYEQRKIISVEIDRTLTSYALGKFSGLRATFVFHRYLDYHFLHLYSPCAIVVVLSWISFFIPKERVGARIKLSIVATLTITTLLNQLNKVLPNVSYVKLVDWYLIVSSLFVYAVFAEFTFVLWLTEKEMQRVENQVAKEKKSDTKRLENVKADDNAEGVEEDKEEEPEDDEDRESQGLANTHHAFVFSYRLRIAVIDEIARVVFPLAYVIFNAIYWVFFCGKMSQLSQ